MVLLSNPKQNSADRVEAVAVKWKKSEARDQNGVWQQAPMEEQIDFFLRKIIVDFTQALRTL